jgi:hypothetical protein
MSLAVRPLTLVEIDAIIWRLLLSVENDPSVEEKWKDTYYSLLKLFRGDRLSTSLRGVTITSAMFFGILALTAFRFKYDELSDCQDQAPHADR